MDDPLTARNREPGCPPWCQADHSKNRGHWGPDTVIRGLGQHPFDSVTISAADVAGTPEVNVYASRFGSDYGHLWLAPDIAIEIARLVEMLAGASRRRHHQVAKAIREAARLITAADAPPDAAPAARQSPAQAPEGSRRAPVMDKQPGTAPPDGPRPRL